MLYNTAYVLATQGHVERAMAHYRACLELAPTYTAAQHNLGMLLYESGRTEEALDEFDQVLALDPDHPRTRVSRGWALLTLGRPATEVFREATLSTPEDDLAWHGLGSALHREHREAERSDDAADAFRRALELEPQHAGAACKLGAVSLRADQLDDAVSWLRRCVELRPTDAGSRAWLGWAPQRRGEHEAAIAEYRTALSMDPDNEYAIRGLEQPAVEIE
jgi:Flp pilus assembly protein TadD